MNATSERSHHTIDPWPESSLAARFDRLLNRLGLRTALRRDALLAACVAIAFAAAIAGLGAYLRGVEGIDVPLAQFVAIGAVAVAQSATIILRRVRPALALALAAALQVGIIALLPTDVSLTGVAVFVVAYSVGAHLTGVAMIRALTVAALIEIIGAALARAAAPAIAGQLFGTTPPAGENYVLLTLNHAIAAALVYAVAAFVGNYVATRAKYIELLRLRASEAVAQQRSRTEAAIGAERTRMARELHDIAAHHLSGLVVQASAAERLVERDPEAARSALRWIRSQGKATLANLRLVVGVLREDTVTLDDGGAPVPGLAVIDELIDATRTLGGTVELTRRGAPFTLSPIADVTFYRVLQESLSNARQHAPGQPIRVDLAYTAAGVSLCVDNAVSRDIHRTAKDPARGLGLVGMRERANLIGADFDASPSENGWRVSLTLAVDAADRNEPDEWSAR